jgi:hypothetical protein
VTCLEIRWPQASGLADRLPLVTASRGRGGRLRNVCAAGVSQRSQAPCRIGAPRPGASPLTPGAQNGEFWRLAGPYRRRARDPVLGCGAPRWAMREVMPWARPGTGRWASRLELKRSTGAATSGWLRRSCAGIVSIAARAFRTRRRAGRGPSRKLVFSCVRHGCEFSRLAHRDQWPCRGHVRQSYGHPNASARRVRSGTMSRRSPGVMPGCRGHLLQRGNHA